MFVLLVNLFYVCVTLVPPTAVTASSDCSKLYFYDTATVTTITTTSESDCVTACFTVFPIFTGCCGIEACANRCTCYVLLTPSPCSICTATTTASSTTTELTTEPATTESTIADSTTTESTTTAPTTTESTTTAPTTTESTTTAPTTTELALKQVNNGK
ncbi:salivary glue protein Sgs-3 [Lingula anatina]|uniref:Salivary glue protein Sgs-3 n=1 Tax=Lingula anatina TaxID=7574 RepID=A0A1S3H3Z2_LINAN|nr:salivary glue protein Sgs-3 [Lingula anatina]|eukprot:XP_013380723.1 salivary glue protein Sgs-3 [Lingula anatina]